MPLETADLLAAFALLQISNGTQAPPQQAPAAPAAPYVYTPEIISGLDFTKALKTIADCEGWFANLIERNVMIIDDNLQSALSKAIVAAKDLSNWLQRVHRLDQVMDEIDLNWPMNMSVAWQMTIDKVTDTMTAIHSHDNGREKIVENMTGVGVYLNTYVNGTDTWSECWKIAQPVHLGLKDQQRGPGQMTQLFQEARAAMQTWQNKQPQEETKLPEELQHGLHKVVEFLELAENCWDVVVEKFQNKEKQ